MANRLGKQWQQWETLFFWSPKSWQMVTAAMKLKDTCSLEEKLESMGFPRQEHWSALPCPPLGDLPNSGTETASPMVLALAGGPF